MRRALSAFTLFFGSFSAAAAPFSPAETQVVARADGSLVTAYLRTPPTHRNFPILLVLQGSQPESVVDHLATELDVGARGAGLLMIEKPGVSTGSVGCSDEYLARNTLDARLADIEQVLASLRRKHDGEGAGWNGRLYILGGSEGGALAAKAAERLGAERAVLLVTGGGQTMAEAFPFILRHSMDGATEEQIQQAIDSLPALFDEIRRNPLSLQTFGECSTYKYWNTMLWYRPLDSMLRAPTRFLLVHGTADTSHPVESARQTFAAFQGQAPERLTYWELKGFDHGLRGPEGAPQIMRIVVEALDWLLVPN
jgi:dipeptidyl aminopeptidase/acylaminoacyl peptidase